MTAAGRLPLAGAGVRAVVAGNGSHATASRLPDLPQVAGTVQAVGRCLVERCGMAPEALRLVTDPPGPAELLDTIAGAAEEADDVLFVYYTGHGVLSPSGQLHLATRATRDLTAGMAAYQALPQEELHNVLINCRARTVAVLLDCCFSGRAALPPRPGFLLTSASGEDTAFIPPGAAHPAFTGALLELLTEGDPDGPPQFTLDHVHRVLARRFNAERLPVPRMQERDRAGELVLAPNPAYRPPPTTLAPPAPAITEAGDEICPYPGLAAFTAEDARFFHGRDRATADLVRFLAVRAFQGGMVVIIGPSGSGKSSLLQAGLLSAVRRGELGVPGSAGWTPVLLTPGADPVGALAAALASAAASARASASNPENSSESRSETVEEYAASLRRDPANITSLLVPSSVPDDHDGPWQLLVVDQFEELFTQGADARARSDFVAALVAAARADSERPPAAVVVLSLRGDFYGECMDDPRLRESLAERPVLLGAMTTGQLREAIGEPSRTAGYELMPGLAELLLHDLGCDPDAPDAAAPDAGVLPLLSHGLREIWRRRAGRLLTVEGYQATGGIGSALARTADETYTQLSAAGRDAVARMLPRLVTVGGDRPDTLRRASLAELLAGLPDPQAGRHALHLLAAARLVTLDAEGASITHEALIRSWPRLRGWIDADRAWLRAAQQLHADARAWDSAGREPSRLYRGAALAATRHELELLRRRADLPSLTVQFLDAATAQERRGARLRRGMVAVLAAITALALVASGMAVLAQRTAEEQRAGAEARRDELAARVLATQAATLRRTDPGLARQLTVAAYRWADSPAVGDAVLAAAALPKVATAPAAQRQPLMPSAFLPSGDIVAVVHPNDDVHQAGVDLRDATSFAVVGEIREAFTTSGEAIHIGAVPDLAVTAQGHLVLAAQLGLWIWDVTDPAAPRALAFRPAVEPGAGVERHVLRSVAVQPGGTLIAYRGEGHSTLLLSVADPRSPAVVAELTGAGGPGRLAFSPDGRLLAAHNHEDGTVVLLDVTDPERTRTVAILPDAAEGPPSFPELSGIAFGAGGLLAYAGDAGEIQLWLAAGPDDPTQLGTIPGGSGIVQAIAFTPDGRLLVTGADNGTIRVIDLTSPGGPDPLGALDDHVAGITGVAIAPDGESMVTGSKDGSARQWPFVDPRHRGASATLAEHSVEVLAADAERDTLVTVTTTGFSVWDSRDPRRPLRLSSADLGRTASAGGIQAALSPDGATLAVATFADPAVLLFDLTDPVRPRQVADVDAPFAAAVAVSGDGRLLAVGNTIGQLSLFDITDPAQPTRLAVVNGPELAEGEQFGWITALAFDPARPLLAAASWESPLTMVWDLTDPGRPRLVMSSRDHRHQVYAVRFSPDGQWLASADRDGTVLVWAVGNTAAIGNGLHPAHTIETLVPTTPAIDFSQDGRLLAVAANDGSIRLWGLAGSGGLVHELALPAGPGPRAVQFGPSGQTISVAFDGAAAATYVVDPALMAELLCDGAGQPITEQQWRAHLPDRPYDPPCPDH